MSTQSPSKHQAGLVVFAKNKKRVSAFYQETLRLNIKESEPSHDLLAGRGYEIVVHAIPRRYAAGTKVTKPPVPREDTPLKPTFVVGSLKAVRQAAEATGGYLRPDAEAWHFRGCTVLDGWDPEGNIIQFKERDKSRS